MNENGHKSESEVESARIRLRARWELASVLNFLQVFESVIGSELKIDAEEIEQSLILPDRRLRLLHIALLKGIPPVSRNLKDPDAWVVILSKKVFMWWPWVAQGEFPLKAAKGAEMETYKNLDPTVRLVILKALCEIRADQHDVIAYINDAVKIKKEVSAFRKKNIGEDGKGTSYWLDGNETIGFRLYKEVNTLKGKETPSTMSYQWETLATNLEEFEKVMDEYSSSKSKLEVAIRTAVETEAIPVLKKMFKQRELQKKMNEERIINNFSRSGITRSCRNRNAISYTFDEYDKVISEAIRDGKKMKTRDEQKSVKKENVAKEDPQQAGEGESSESDEKVGSGGSGEDSDENVGSKDEIAEDSGEESDEVAEDSGEESDEIAEESGEESDENVVSNDSGEESDENDVSEASDEESDENVASEASGDESDENDKENMNHKDRKTKSRNQQRIKKKETEESEAGESTESDSESGKLEAKDISENDDDNKENTNNISKKNTENGDRFIQEKQHFGTKKRLVQRPNRNTALESAIVPDSEDEVSSENSDD
ncbi:hypothetical protein HanXRQr2_Chr11g0516821 [Helianthus annuus]|uniref:Uncharacterized protein n=1 Tax=Helianthus annuus TaxID=4232 RepID=A0A9K3N256_HELAN|nr:hypothetical protein HanXRQr2_Chr11g0516821 [Helianthus annuus]KAJ0877273.1 hypothetical protein HanPSC8_Chr11g0498191 [Helianthus annuus]